MTYLTFLLLLSVVLGVVRPSLTQKRVVGGHDAESKQFPHQVSLRRDHNHICGGSIVSSKYVLTAAHCVVIEGTEAYPADRFSIRVGSLNRIAGGRIVPVKRVVVHPGYVIYNDLALLELQEELVFSETIKAIDLYDNEVPPNSNVLISGWGLTEHAGANLPIYLQWYNHPAGAGACNGDSGGPATYNNKLVGVAGFVVIKCGSSRPDGYAKVSYNSNWISENMI